MIELDQDNLMKWATVKAADLRRLNDQIGPAGTVSSKVEFRSDSLSGYKLIVELVPEHELDEDDE